MSAPASMAACEIRRKNALLTSANWKPPWNWATTMSAPSSRNRSIAVAMARAE